MKVKVSEFFVSLQNPSYPFKESSVYLGSPSLDICEKLIKEKYPDLQVESIKGESLLQKVENIIHKYLGEHELDVEGLDEDYKEYIILRRQFSDIHEQFRQILQSVQRTDSL